LRELSRICGQHPINGFDAGIDISQSILERLATGVTCIELIDLRLQLTTGAVQIIQLIRELALLRAITLVDSASTRRRAWSGDANYYWCCRWCWCRSLEQAILSDDLHRGSAARIIYVSRTRISSRDCESAL
jgi:hypothetical protein